MLDRVHGRIVFECDDCGDPLETDETDFAEAMQMMRDEGWKSVKYGDVWQHRCAGCSRTARTLFDE